MHSVTDRQADGRTDGRPDDANSRSYCVAVRSLFTVRLEPSSVLQCQNSEVATNYLAQTMPNVILTHYAAIHCPHLVKTIG